MKTKTQTLKTTTLQKQHWSNKRGESWNTLCGIY